jgi:hypothetical protein
MMMPQDFIRKIAYAIWEKEGRPDGKDLDHWFRATAIFRSTPPYSSVADLFEAGRERRSASSSTARSRVEPRRATSCHKYGKVWVAIAERYP